MFNEVFIESKDKYYYNEPFTFEFNNKITFTLSSQKYEALEMSVNVHLSTLITNFYHNIF